MAGGPGGWLAGMGWAICWCLGRVVLDVLCSVNVAGKGGAKALGRRGGALLGRGGTKLLRRGDAKFLVRGKSWFLKEREMSNYWG